MSYTPEEKEAIFVERSREKYPETWRHYCDAVSRELMTADEMAGYNFERRKEMVAFAYENTEFYRNYYDSLGFRPDMLREESDWARVPAITKETVRRSMPEMVVGGLDGALARGFGMRVQTGGSTGEPLELVRDMRNEQAGSMYWRMRGWWSGRGRGVVGGGTLGQDEAIVWRANGVNVKSPGEIKREQEEYFPMEKFYLDAQNMTPENIERFVESLKGRRYYMRGYAGAVNELARYCVENGVTLAPIAVSTVSCPVDELMRRSVSTAFGCDVYDLYGSKEVQNMAAECGCGGHHHLHVLSDFRHIDILDDRGRPVHGEDWGVVHVTSFNNFVMPLIKYRMGDLSRWINEPCPCGLPFPLMHRVIGRETESIPDANGVAVYQLESNIYTVPDCITAFQLVVHGPGDVTVSYVANEANPVWEEGVERIRAFYEEAYDGRFAFDFVRVESIPHDGGKQRYVVFDR